MYNKIRYSAIIYFIELLIGMNDNGTARRSYKAGKSRDLRRSNNMIIDFNRGINNRLYIGASDDATSQPTSKELAWEMRIEWKCLTVNRYKKNAYYPLVAWVQAEIVSWTESISFTFDLPLEINARSLGCTVKDEDQVHEGGLWRKQWISGITARWKVTKQVGASVSLFSHAAIFLQNKSCFRNMSQVDFLM